MPVFIELGPAFDADVIVAGAGPAGAAAAAHLARAGVRVLVLDRARFPRDKVCGDFVGPVGLVELRALGLHELPEYKDSYVIRQAAVYLNGRELIREDIPEVPGLPRHGRVIPRERFDHWLVECARQSGAEMREGSQVTGYEVDAHGVSVWVGSGAARTRLRARLLIGADGSSSLIARTLRGHGLAPSDRIIAVRGYFENVRAVPAQAELYFSSDSFPGYYWFFPAGKGIANVGVGMVRETLPAHDPHLRELLLDLVQTDPVLRERLRGARLRGSVAGWPLATYNPALPSVGDRVMLVGDAAGLINPLNGEGIQFALLSGRWAAETARACLSARELGAKALTAYQDKLEHELRYDMALAAMIVQLIRNRDLNPLWLWALGVIATRARRDPEYAALAGGILAGLLPARDALGAKMIGGTLSQLVRALSLGTVVRGATRPGALLGSGVAAAGMGFQLLYDALHDPRATARWGAGVASMAVELGTQVGADMLRSATLRQLPETLAVHSSRSTMYITSSSTARLSSESGSAP